VYLGGGVLARLCVIPPGKGGEGAARTVPMALLSGWPGARVALVEPTRLAATAAAQRLTQREGGREGDRALSLFFFPEALSEHLLR